MRREQPNWTDMRKTRLPDLALLALLQHHRAATPLMDVTLDPIVGLYMSVVGP